LGLRRRQRRRTAPTSGSTRPSGSASPRWEHLLRGDRRQLLDGGTAIREDRRVLVRGGIAVPQLVIRAADRSDSKIVATMIEEIERYYGATAIQPFEERLAQVEAALFGTPPLAFLLLALVDGEVVGLAAYSFLWPAAGSTHSLFLNSLDPFGVIGLQPTELVTPPVVGELGNLQLAADVRDVFALVEHPIGLGQLPHDLLRCVPLPGTHRGQAFPPTTVGRKTHSTRINQEGSRHWKQTPAIFPNGLPAPIRNTVPTNNGVWAPDVIYSPTQHLFLMYYSIANWDNDEQSAIGLITSPTLNPNASNYHWTDHGVLISWSANNGSTIDPAPFYDTSGNLWLSYGSGYGTHNRNRAVNIIALDKNTGMRSSNQTVYNQLACGCEGSYLQYHAGSYFLFWNTGGCCSGASSTYVIHVARSSSPTGPYTERSTTFRASTSTQHGPGHIGILSENGKDYYSYHYYPNSGGSVLGFGTITWGSDGWPNS
jgi:hypothetical protein